jgi:hypothetical protein
LIIYPVEIPRDPYSGHDAAKLRRLAEEDRVAKRIETFLNEQVETMTEASRIFSSGTVAIALGEDAKLVGDLIFRLDCGGNGVTIAKR